MHTRLPMFPVPHPLSLSILLFSPPPFEHVYHIYIHMYVPFFNIKIRTQIGRNASQRHDINCLSNPPTPSGPRCVALLPSWWYENNYMRTQVSPLPLSFHYTVFGSAPKTNPTRSGANPPTFWVGVWGPPGPPRPQKSTISNRTEPCIKKQVYPPTGAGRPTTTRVHHADE